VYMCPIFCVVMFFLLIEESFVSADSKPVVKTLTMKLRTFKQINLGTHPKTERQQLDI